MSDSDFLIGFLNLQIEFIVFSHREIIQKKKNLRLKIGGNRQELQVMIVSINF